MWTTWVEVWTDCTKDTKKNQYVDKKYHLKNITIQYPSMVLISDLYIQVIKQKSF